MEDSSCGSVCAAVAQLLNESSCEDGYATAEWSGPGDQPDTRMGEVNGESLGTATA
jgi:hypothetical protein